MNKFLIELEGNDGYYAGLEREDESIDKTIERLPEILLIHSKLTIEKIIKITIEEIE